MINRRDVCLQFNSDGNNRLQIIPFPLKGNRKSRISEYVLEIG